MQGGELGYRSSWDGFWRGVAATKGEVLWDSEPSDAVERELPMFAPHLESALTLLDVGCGPPRLMSMTATCSVKTC
ncbi:MAG: hypothetical protein ACRD12_06970 [Acidimicrobiales bacterium]